MTTKSGILKVVRRKCLDCSGGRRGDVRTCPLSACPLWPYRMGADPEPGIARGCARPALAGSSSADRSVGRHGSSRSLSLRHKPALARMGPKGAQAVPSLPTGRVTTQSLRREP